MKLVFASNNAHKLQEVRAILSGVEVVGLREVGFSGEIAEPGETLEANSYIKAKAVADYLDAADLWAGIDGVFADDTGLEVAALGGKPGVRTARWAGEPASDANNRAKLLSDIAAIAAHHQDEREADGIADRSAQFRTVITLLRPKTQPKPQPQSQPQSQSISESCCDSECSLIAHPVPDANISATSANHPLYSDPSFLPTSHPLQQVEGVVLGRITPEPSGSNGFGYDPIFAPEGYSQTFAELSPDIKNAISHRARAVHALLAIL